MDPTERLLSLVPRSKRGPVFAAVTAAVMAIGPLVVVGYFVATSEPAQPQAQKSPPPTATEIDALLRHKLIREGQTVTIADMGGVQIMPLPVQWSVNCQFGRLSVSFGADTEIALSGPGLDTTQCAALARSTAQTIKDMLD